MQQPERLIVKAMATTTHGMVSSSKETSSSKQNILSRLQETFHVGMSVTWCYQQKGNFGQQSQKLKLYSRNKNESWHASFAKHVVERKSRHSDENGQSGDQAPKHPGVQDKQVDQSCQGNIWLYGGL